MLSLRSVLLGGFVLMSLGGCADEASTQAVARAKLAEGCVLDSDCADPLVCAFQRCHQRCADSRDCPDGDRCVLAVSPVHVCQLDDERECGQNRSCPSGQLCSIDAECRDECAGDRDCVSGQVCTGGACAEPDELTNGVLVSKVDSSQPIPCQISSECPEGLRCRGGLCGPPCTSDSECGAGATCDEKGNCVPDDASTCPAAGESCTCDDGSASKKQCRVIGGALTLACACSTGGAGAGGQSSAGGGSGAAGQAGAGMSGGSGQGGAGQAGAAGQGGAGQGGAGAGAGGAGQGGSPAGQGGAGGASGQGGAGGVAGTAGTGGAAGMSGNSGQSGSAGGPATCAGDAAENPLGLVFSLDQSGFLPAGTSEVTALMPCTNSGQSCGFWLVTRGGVFGDFAVTRLSPSLTPVNTYSLGSNFDDLSNLAVTDKGELVAVIEQGSSNGHSEITPDIVEPTSSCWYFNRGTDATTTGYYLQTRPAFPVWGYGHQVIVTRFALDVSVADSFEVSPSLLVVPGHDPPQYALCESTIGGLVVDGDQVWLAFNHIVEEGELEPDESDGYTSDNTAKFHSVALRFGPNSGGTPAQRVPLIEPFEIFAKQALQLSPNPRFETTSMQLWRPAGDTRLVIGARYAGSPTLPGGAFPLPSNGGGLNGSLTIVTLDDPPTLKQGPLGTAAGISADRLLKRGDDAFFFTWTSTTNEGWRGVLSIDPFTGITTKKVIEKQDTLLTAQHPTAGDKDVVVMQKGPGGLEVARLGELLQSRWRRRMTATPTAVAVGADGKVVVAGSSSGDECLGATPITSTPSATQVGVFVATYAY